MASSSAPLNEELQCSICLDVFTDPVTTPCGHNFCRTCLNKCWTNTQTCFCPVCKETFIKKPDLKINTTLREVVQHFKEKLSLEEPEVFCDICDDRKQKAVKSCLMCPSSYCETHLEPHLRVPRLQKHKLINAVGNLEDYICEKHQRPVELFCRDDQTCVCLSCTEGEHRNHNTVPVEQESQHKKCQLVKTQADALYAIQNRMKKIEDIKHSVEMRKGNTEKEKSASVDLFTDLLRSIERCQSDTLKMMEEEQKAAENQAEDLIQELKQEITELKKRNTELEQISRSKDHLHLIQNYPSLCSPLIKKTWTEVSISSDVNVRTLTEALTELKRTLDDKLQKNVMKRLWLLGVVVIPDYDTNNPHLSLPDYGQGIEYCGSKIKCKNHPKRFDQYPCVLGEKGFSSGRVYFELQLRGNRRWDFGVARESVNRKGPIKLCPRNGFWTVSQKYDWHYARQDQEEVRLYQKVKPDTVGLLLDYDEGLVSFYNVDSCTLMYSFTGQTFTEKLYPFFGHKGDTIMYISDPFISCDYY